MQIELLNAEMKLRDAVIKNQRLLQRVYVGIILFSLAFALVLYYAYVQKRRANKLLEEKMRKYQGSTMPLAVRPMNCVS